MRAIYGDETVLLKKRKLMPFERLLLQALGGARILKDLAGKEIDDQIGYVYDYQITTEKYDTERQQFLLVSDRKMFQTRYEAEHSNQLAAMNDDEGRVKSSVFANELLELYELARSVIRDQPEVEIYIAAANCLPVHQ